MKTLFFGDTLKAANSSCQDQSYIGKIVGDPLYFLSQNPGRQTCSVGWMAKAPTS